MNFIAHGTLLLNKVRRILRITYFLGIQKWIYSCSYNTNGNSFVCNGLINISITGSGNSLIIHEGVIFSEGGRIRIDDHNNTVEIGKHSTFVNCYFAVNDNDGKIIIGEDCMFSGQITIRNSDVHSVLNKEGKRINMGKNTIVGNRVWIGAGAAILKGTEIGDDVVVGTQSVVAGLSVPCGCIVAGNPAKIIKTDIHWCRERL